MATTTGASFAEHAGLTGPALICMPVHSVTALPCTCPICSLLQMQRTLWQPAANAPLTALRTAGATGKAKRAAAMATAAVQAVACSLSSESRSWSQSRRLRPAQRSCR